MDGMEPDVLVFSDAGAWREWLDANENVSDGGWLLLAKKGAPSPTSLTYAQALGEALCSGWIDGQRKGYDKTAFLQRFTPRRSRSVWSQRNVEHVARLGDEGRMRPRGEQEVERAKADGRWDRAYAGPATAKVPDDLAAALAALPGARDHFDALSGQNRYAALHQLMTAASPVVRQRRLKKLVAMLARGETMHPR